MQLKDLLSGKKLYMHTFDIRPVSVPRWKDVSINQIFERVKDCEEVMKYIPEFDQEKYTAKEYLDRAWFFNIINTIDPSFFPKVIEEIDEQRLIEHRNENPEEHEVTVVQELVDLIEHGVGTMQGRKSAALGRLKLGSKKRKAPKTREPYTYTATIRPDYV